MSAAIRDNLPAHTCFDSIEGMEYRGTFFKALRITACLNTKAKIMETTRMYEAQPLVLRLCPSMVGVKEAWLIGKILHVSPAVFQLLTDEDDRVTAQIVIDQITIENHSFDDLDKRDKDLVPGRPVATMRDIIIFAVVEGK